MIDAEFSLQFVDVRPTSRARPPANQSRDVRPFTSPTVEAFGQPPLLSRLGQQAPVEDSFALVKWPAEQQLRALVYLIAICERMNWDVLLRQVASRLADRTNGFAYDRVSKLRRGDIEAAFAGYTREDGSLRLPKRLGALKAIADTDRELGLTTALAHTTRLAGPGGVYNLLEAAEPYRADPMRKKANILVHELLRRDLLRVEDEHRVRPAIDYHIIRVMLRTGRVHVGDAQIERALRMREPLPLRVITSIRKAVSDAVVAEANRTGIPIPEANEMIWALGRRHCRRDQAACATGSCPLQDLCKSARQNVRDMLSEPDSHHGFY